MPRENYGQRHLEAELKGVLAVLRLCIILPFNTHRLGRVENNFITV